MSLGDHLEELRTRLILAILGLALGAAVSLIFGTHIIRFIERPYISSMAQRIKKTEPPVVEPNSVALVEMLFTNMAAQARSDANAPVLDPNQLEFLRRVCVATLRQWHAEQMPAAAEGIESLPRYARLQTLAPAEAFSAYMKVSFIAGLILTSPWVFYQLWMFVAAGLYEHERRYVRTAVPFSAALFVAGALFFLFVVAPISLKFFLAFGDLISAAPNWTLQRYISFVTVLMLVFGLAFQTPIAIFILNRTGLVSLSALRSARKYVFLVVFIVAAVVTPPDVISQVLLGIPLYALYELGILLAQLANKRAAAKKQQESSSS
ncbi:MAG: twin-arginine translocase subunit TatC [Sedimentisphaerales bacterium]|nr:twin-arginine translocase subunit TatC [Sedimentisphaerales bacterium]